MPSHTRPRNSEFPEAFPTLRTAGVHDAVALADLAVRTFRDTYLAGSHAADVNAYVDAHFAPTLQGAELADPVLVTLVAEHSALDGAPLVGYAQLRAGAAPACVVGPRPVEIARFYVDRAWHGRGLADRLMCRVLAAADQLAGSGGADPVWLVVYQRNARAVGFYRRRGFTVVGEQPFQMGAERQEDYVMVLPRGTATASGR